MAEQSFRILKLYNASVQEPTLGAIFREETPSLGVRDCAVPEFRINRRKGKVNGQKKGVRVAGTRSGGGRGKPEQTMAKRDPGEAREVRPDKQVDERVANAGAARGRRRPFRKSNEGEEWRRPGSAGILTRVIYFNHSGLPLRRRHYLQIRIRRKIEPFNSNRVISVVFSPQGHTLRLARRVVRFTSLGLVFLPSLRPLLKEGRTRWPAGRRAG